ncbi:MAG: hypothetical protein EPO40_27190 [Myxococcaceae bacterium]|nr:MAG: hypothetical protein EPO40_27190 [Myxococcaceae bacterium]
MNRQQRRAAARDAARNQLQPPAAADALARCKAIGAEVREAIQAALAAGADPADIAATIDDGGRDLVVCVESRRALVAEMEHDGAAGAAGLVDLAARLRAFGPSAWFPVVYAGPSGTGLTAIRFHLLSPGGDA